MRVKRCGWNTSTSRRPGKAPRAAASRRYAPPAAEDDGAKCCGASGGQHMRDYLKKKVKHASLTIGPLVCEALRKHGVTAPIDVHLMVAHPLDRGKAKPSGRA